MKQADWRRFAKSRLLPQFPGAVVVRDMLVLPDGEWLLKAIAMESSDFSPTRFTMEAFVLPLYIPTKYVYFLFGGRLGTLSGGVECWWDTAETGWETSAAQAVRNEAGPFLETLKEPVDLIGYARQRLAERRSGDPSVLEIEGYSYILGNDGPSGQRTLWECLDRIDQLSRPPRWIADVAARVRQINAALAVDLSSAHDILRSWSEGTLTALKLAHVKSADGAN